MIKYSGADIRSLPNVGNQMLVARGMGVDTPSHYDISLCLLPVLREPAVEPQGTSTTCSEGAQNPANCAFAPTRFAVAANGRNNGPHRRIWPSW